MNLTDEYCCHCGKPIGGKAPVRPGFCYYNCEGWQRTWAEIRMSTYQLPADPPDFTGYTTTAGIELEFEAEVTEEGQLFFDELLKVAEQLKRHGPVIKGIWFVDRPEDYEVFTSQFPVVNSEPGRWPGLADIPIRQVSVGDPGMSLRLPPWWTKFLPGIWVEMSDGRHRSVENVKVLIDAFAAMG